MDVHPPKNGIYRYWSIAIYANLHQKTQSCERWWCILECEPPYISPTWICMMILDIYIYMYYMMELTHTWMNRTFTGQDKNADVSCSAGGEGSRNQSTPFVRKSTETNWNKHYLLVVYLPLWKIWVRQLGWLLWLFPIYGKVNNIPNHQPEKLCSHEFDQAAGHLISWISSFGTVYEGISKLFI